MGRVGAGFPDRLVRSKADNIGISRLRCGPTAHNISTRRRFLDRVLYEGLLFERITAHITRAEELTGDPAGI